MNPDNEGWFNQFSMLFEVVSAYATIGLSLGK
jgi:Trk-type K+ transport system membrane component